jgi:hypothetical protein
MSSQLETGLLSHEEGQGRDSGHLASAQIGDQPRTSEESVASSDEHAYAIKRADGTTWETLPVNTWLLYKLFVTFMCILSLCEALGSLVTLVILGMNGAWVAFTVALVFVLLSSCITSIGGIFLTDPQSQPTTREAVMPFVLAFFKLGAFRIAWRTVWFPRRDSGPDDDISEHLLPLSLFLGLVCVIESAPLLLLKAYMLGLFMEESAHDYWVPGSFDSSMDLHSLSGVILLGTIAISLTFQACVPVLFEKVGSDFRGIFVADGRATRHQGQLFNPMRCVCLFFLRFFEGAAWILTLAAFAHVFHAWFFLLLFVDFVISCALSCALADPNEDDWEISATFRVFFSLFFTNPLHDGDAVMVFRARAPTLLRQRPSMLPLLLHFGSRLLQQCFAIFILLVLGDIGDVSDVVVLMVIAIAVCTALTWLTLALAVRIMPDNDAVLDSMHWRRRPDGISDELYASVVAAVWALSGRLSTRSFFHCKIGFYGAFVSARRALNSQKRRFPARAGRELLRCARAGRAADEAGLGAARALPPHAAARVRASGHDPQP